MGENMNLINLIFKKKFQTKEIIRFGDNIVIPGRDYFDNEKDIILLEEYQKHYLKEMFKRRVITTKEFNSDNLKQKIKMNVDLILKLFMENDDFYYYAPEELLIQSLKLEMYYEEINALEKEITLRLIALLEIKESKIIPRRNIMSLEEEINQLSVILEIYLPQKSIIKQELKNYLGIASTKDLEKINLSIIEERLNKLLFVSKEIIDNQEIEKYENIKTKIAVLERECERYAYQNKEEADKLKESYDLADENKILLFYQYGKNYYDEEFMRKFYSYKFNILTQNINNEFIDSPINRKDYGFEYYKDIIASEIEDMQNSYYFSKLTSERTDIKELLGDAKRYLKNEHEEFDFEEILLNKYKLAFLVSLKYENGLKEFFDKNMIHINESNDFNDLISKCPTGIAWNDYFPLASLFEFVDCELNNPLFNFYELNKEDNNLILPEGVKVAIFHYIDNKYIDKLNNTKSNIKTYITPNSLKSIYGFPFINGYKYIPLYLNDGLECIGDNLFDFHTKFISIPSSVKVFGLLHSSYNGIIEFRDFENSIILNDETKFTDFISNFSIEVDTKKIKRHYPSAENLFIQEFMEERYKEGYYSIPYDPALFDVICDMCIYELRFSFKYLCFKSERLEEPIVIPSSVLTTEFTKESSIYTNYDDVYSKIRNVLLEKTGYDISVKKSLEEKSKF